MASGSGVLQKTIGFNRDIPGEIECSYTCEHGTVHTHRFPANRDALMEEIRDYGLHTHRSPANHDALMEEIREYGLQRRKLPRRRSWMTGDDRETKSSKPVRRSLSQSKTSSARRGSSHKRFVLPRRDLNKTQGETVKVSGSDFNDSLDLRDFFPICREPLRHDPYDSEDHDSDTDTDDWDETYSNISEQTEKIREELGGDDGDLLTWMLLHGFDEDELYDDELFMNLDGLRDNGRLLAMKNKAALNFPCGPEISDECLVCFETKNLCKRLCCDFAVCDECIEKYLTYEVERGVVKIECINGTCDSYVHRDEILGRLPSTIKDKYYRFLVDANKDPNIKTCPRCSNIYNRIERGVLGSYGKYGVKVECPDCKLDWCFDCQAPWHANIKCKNFRKGDALLKSWAREQHFGHQNAQRCPRCKIFIERSGGCDHMECSKCHTSFCYRCGDRFMDLKFFGNHMSRLSPLGCKYNYKPNEPVKRRLVRGSLLGAQILGGVCLLGLGLAAGAVLVGASVIILPVLGGLKFHRARKIRRRTRKRKKLLELRATRAQLESLREQTDIFRGRYRRELGQRDGPVHIGIQTGSSQQVDVTVHNTYLSDDRRDDVDFSEVMLDIKDDNGRFTRTTAEVIPGNGDEDEGDMVVQIRTEYAPHSNSQQESPDIIKESYTNPPQESPDIVKDSEKEIKLDARRRSSGHGSLSSRGSSCSSSRANGGRIKTLTKKTRRNSGPQSEKRESKKLENESDHSIKKNTGLAEVDEHSIKKIDDLTDDSVKVANVIVAHL